MIIGGRERRLTLTTFSIVGEGKDEIRGKVMSNNMEFDIEKPCVYCEGVSDFVMIEGGWYVCAGCIKEGETDIEALSTEGEE